MVLMSGLDIPIRAIREYIASAIDLVVNIERMSDGKRKVTSIAELENFKEGELQLKEIFAFHQKGLTSTGEVDGEYVLYNETVPKVYKKITTRGITDLDFMFKK